MEFLPTNRLFQFRSDQLEYVRKQHNFSNAVDMNQAIDILEDWVKMQKHFMKKNFPRNYLEKTIIENKGSLERAKRRLDKICTFRTMMPDFFGKKLTKNEFDGLDTFLNCLLPHTTDKYYRTCILKVVGSVFTHEKVMDCYRILILICEYVLAHDYSDGYVIIIDYTEANLVELIKYFTITELRQILTIITEGFGMRMKGIHFITTSTAVNTLVSLVKQILSPKLGKRIYVHKDITNLYKYVPQDLFPLEYGGKEKSFNKLVDDLISEITGNEFRKYVEDINNATTDESYRQKDLFNENYLGMPGTFRTLSVD